MGDGIKVGDRVWLMLPDRRRLYRRAVRFEGTVQALDDRGVHINLDPGAPTRTCYATYDETTVLPAGGADPR